jgi:signal transduction histidine kinase
MKIWKKIILGFLSTIAILMVVDIMALHNNIQIINDIHKLEQSQRVELSESSNLAFSLQIVNSNTREIFIEHNDHKESIEVSDAKRIIGTRLPLLSASVKAITKATTIGYNLDNDKDKEGEGEELRRIDSLNTKINSFISTSDKVLKLLNENRLSEARELFENKTEPNSREIQKMITFLADDAEAEVKDAIELMDVHVNKAIKSGIYLTILSVFFALGIGFFISRSISVPLRMLTSRAHEIGKGNLEASVVVNSNDELGSLAESFNQMAKELKIKIDSINDLNKKLAESNDTKNKFFSIIAHDLINPFNAILGYSELLAKEYNDFDDAERRIFIHNIHKSAKNTFELLENLLLWARSQMNKIDIIKEVLDLREIVNKAIGAYIPSAENKQITYSINIPDKLIIRADKFTLTTIITNLFSNAIKFTPEKGHININASRKNNFVEISISDNGVGISKDNIPKLFQIENNVSTMGTNKEKGTGLGLLLCKEFVEKNNGKIWVESELEKGTKIIFTIPD